jgi:hypothetical protein
MQARALVAGIMIVAASVAREEVATSLGAQAGVSAIVAVPLIVASGAEATGI